MRGFTIAFWTKRPFPLWKILLYHLTDVMLVSLKRLTHINLFPAHALEGFIIECPEFFLAVHSENVPFSHSGQTVLNQSISWKFIDFLNPTENSRYYFDVPIWYRRTETIGQFTNCPIVFCSS